MVISLSEVDDALFNIANRERLMVLPGLLREVPTQDPEERGQVNACKVPVEQQMQRLSADGRPLFDAEGKPVRPVIVIGSRSVGNNHGVIAWQRDQTPSLFHVRGDPLNYPSYSCLVRHEDKRLSIRSLSFENNGVFAGTNDMTEKITWCVYGNPVLRDGNVVPIEETIDQFYDIRHVLSFDRNHPMGREVEAAIYKGYPERFRQNALRVWHEKAIPRQRFLHSSIGLSEDNLIILQREGTIEEIAMWLRDAGARDGLIFDNGGSVFCWAWWPYPKGGFLFTAPDYRPNASAVVAFVLRGPAWTDLPGGSVSFTVV